LRLSIYACIAKRRVLITSRAFTPFDDNRKRHCGFSRNLRFELHSRRNPPPENGNAASAKNDPVIRLKRFKSYSQTGAP
jgi:hypothetical protein